VEFTDAFVAAGAQDGAMDVFECTCIVLEWFCPELDGPAAVLAIERVRVVIGQMATKPRLSRVTVLTDDETVQFELATTDPGVVESVAQQAGLDSFRITRAAYGLGLRR
jgi:hypothetical protein